MGSWCHSVAGFFRSGLRLGSKLKLAYLILVLVLPSLLVSSSVATVNAISYLGWAQADTGGQVFESDGMLTLSGDDRAAGPNLYKEFCPETDFEVSFQLKAETLGEINRDPNRAGEGFSFGFSTNNGAPSHGAAFEMRARSGGQFLMVWHDDICDLYGWNCNWVPFVYNGLGYNDGSDYWSLASSADKSNSLVKPDVWYTIKLKVTESPFTITSEVFTEDGTLLGSFTVDSINDFTFKDIRYISMSSGFGGTFYVKNITGLTTSSNFDYSPANPVTYSPVLFNSLIDSTENQELKYSWAFGDGNTTTTTSPAISHTYSTAGFYNVTLLIEDNYGEFSFTTKTIQVKQSASLSVFTDSPISVGSMANIYGTLSDHNDKGLASELIVLSYTFDGVNELYPIGSVLTDENGQYSLQWFNSASGTYIIDAKWAGNETFNSVSNSVDLCSIAYLTEGAFLIESNSTVANLDFNSSSGVLRFAVSGPSGSTGYTKISIAKNLLDDANDIKVQLDDKDFNYSLASTVNSWILNFEYTHSQHTIKVSLPQAPTLESNQIISTDNNDKKEVGNLLWGALAAISIATAVVCVILKTKKQQ
jgi:hypothetical protein